VLLAASGLSNRAIGELVGMHYNQVAVWRGRYRDFGLAGLEDEQRSGRPCVYDHDDVLLLVKTVTEPPPDGATRWTMEALAEAMADHGVPISASQVWRICRALDLKPWQVQSWMTSHDPDFWEKPAGDLCGLYLNPPENAVVWSVDEKSGIQAKSRVNPTRPAVPGIPVRREFEYRRHGTVVLYAGLDVHEGTVAGRVTDSTRSDNFVAFLGDLVAQTPARLDLHCIVDHLSTTPPPRWPSSSSRTRTCTCTSHLRTRPGSTRSSCSSRSSSAGCSNTARSTRSTTSLTGSSPSSRTTTDEQPRSDGPTTAAPSRSRKSQ
jgi:transposase